MVSHAAALATCCPEREGLLDLLKAANQELADVHAGEIGAAMLGNLAGFEALQERLAIARNHRDEIVRNLKRHMRQHRC